MTTCRQGSITGEQGPGISWNYADPITVVSNRHTPAHRHTRTHWHRPLTLSVEHMQYMRTAYQWIETALFLSIAVLSFIVKNITSFNYVFKNLPHIYTLSIIEMIDVPLKHRTEMYQNWFYSDASQKSTFQLHLQTNYKHFCSFLAAEMPAVQRSWIWTSNLTLLPLNDVLRRHMVWIAGIHSMFYSDTFMHSWHWMDGMA